MRHWSPATLVAILAVSFPTSGVASDLRVFLGTYTAAETDDARVNVATYDIGVVPVAQSFAVDTCDAPDGATYLRIFDQDGDEIAAGSGGCASGTGARVSVTAIATQRYSVSAGCVGNSTCLGNVSADARVSIIERWAPVVYQDTWPGNYFVPGDYITNFNFDGDYVGINNYNNADQPGKPGVAFVGHVYFSHVETVTHHFIGYYFFHPQDRSCDLNQHENDLEGILVAVRKIGLYGDLIAMQTEAHGDTYQYVTPGLGSTESPAGTPPDGNIETLPDVTVNPEDRSTVAMPYLMAGHPKIYSQPGGHGVWACGDSARGANCDDNDGLVYAWQGGNAADPAAGQCDDGTSGHYDLLDACGYKLVSLDDWGGSSTVADPDVTQGFWVLQNHICPTCTFNTFTNFNGDGSEIDDDPCGEASLCTCTDNSPNPPWQWADHGGVGNGDWLADPARFFDIDFDGPEFSGDRFSHDYVRHPYYTHELQVNRSRVTARQIGDDPVAEMFVLGATVPSHDNESDVLTSYHWAKDFPGFGTWYPWFYGANEAHDQNDWSQADVNHHYFVRQTQVQQTNGSYVNGGRSTKIALHARTQIPQGDEVEVEMLSTVLDPSDWWSGTCGPDLDQGCVERDGVVAFCRVQVNDFTCGEGLATDRGNVEFKLTRVRRPSAPPKAVAGADQTVECSSATGTSVMVDAAGSSDPDLDPLNYFWSAPGVQFADPYAARTSGQFPAGATTVTLRVSDGTTEAFDQLIVTVADSTPPVVTVALTPNSLRPPNHRLVPISATVAAVDACDTAAPLVVLTAITSNEPDNADNDGDTVGDIQGAEPGTLDLSFMLRAERSGTDTGRTYEVTYRGVDSKGNAGTGVGTVRVPIK